MQKLNHYSVEEVIDTYQISRIKQMPALKEWLDAPPFALQPHETSLIESLTQELDDGQYAWNEEELKMLFISPVFRVSTLSTGQTLKTFFERSISGIVRDHKISVVVDCMVATASKSGRPQAPYFFLQEFKRTKSDTHDPEGQMLAAMILSQELNQDEKPLYGSWVQGAFWRFTALKGSEYSTSSAFDATKLQDLYQIVFILRKLKDLILAP